MIVDGKDVIVPGGESVIQERDKTIVFALSLTVRSVEKL